MFNQKIEVNNKVISNDSPPFVIAEISANHNQDLERVFKLIDLAAEARVDAVKIQTYTPETITLNVEKEDFYISNKNSLWYGKTLHELYSEAYLPFEWHTEIFNYARDKGLIIFSSPFDETAVDLLEKLNTPLYKIASYEVTHLPLIRKVAKTGKPVIVSTGMASYEEIQEVLNVFIEEENFNLVLLKCTSTYPANPNNSNIKSIVKYQKEFKTLIGISDHTLGIGVSVASIALGASVIEKHFTDDRSISTPDSAFSLDYKELSQLVVESRRAWESLGTPFIGYTTEEEIPRKRRRSIYISKNIKSGQRISSEHIKIVRPGNGLLPKHYDDLIGRITKVDLEAGTPTTWDYFK